VDDAGPLCMCIRLNSSRDPCVLRKDRLRQVLPGLFNMLAIMPARKIASKNPDELFIGPPGLPRPAPWNRTVIAP